MKWLLGALVLLALSACGGEANTATMETEIERSLEDQLNVKDVTVDCPEQIDWESGRDFHCFAEDDRGQTSRVTVTMENDAGEWTWALG